MLWLSVEIEKDWCLVFVFTVSVDFRPQGEGMFDKLRSIETGEAFVKLVSDALITLHVIAPFLLPVGVGKTYALFSPKGFKPFRLDAYKRRRRNDKNIQNWMSSTTPGKTDGLLKIE